VLIVRVDGQLHYANVRTVRGRVQAMIAGMEPPPRPVILDSAAWDHIDGTSTDMLKSLVKELQWKDIDVYLAEVHAPVLDDARRSGLVEIIGEDHVHPTVNSAVTSLESKEIT
jgi:MFS superfamily sulfate permease-like transporter